MPHLLQFLGVEVVAHLDVLEAEVVAILHVAVAGQRVVAAEAELRGQCARYDGLVAVLAPAPCGGIALVVVGAHALVGHAGHVYNLVAHTEVEAGVDGEASVVECDAETTIALGVRVAEVNHIVAVDLSVVVHVLVDGITALELVAVALVVAVVHGQGYSLGVGQHVAVGIEMRWGRCRSRNIKQITSNFFNNINNTIISFY